MNYIQCMQNKVKAAELTVNNVEMDLDQFISFLHSAKFTGTESNGERKDWIATGDAIKILREIKQKMGENMRS